MLTKILIGTLFILPLLVASAGAAGAPRLEKATFAGGCFWCTEAVFVQVRGVVDTAPLLEREFGDQPHVRIVHADILNVNVRDLVGDVPYYVVANLPYYITSAILRRLLEAPHKPRRLVVTVQQEVAERLIAKPGDMSLLAISVLSSWVRGRDGSGFRNSVPTCSSITATDSSYPPSTPGLSICGVTAD